MAKKKKSRQAEIDAIAKKLAEKLPKESFAQKRKLIRRDMTGFLD